MVQDFEPMNPLSDAKNKGAAMDEMAGSHFDLNRSQKKGKVAEGTDRISELPDVILHHMLSFLTTAEAVGTAFLARRWRYLWTHVPTIHFDEEKFIPSNSNGEFVDFVDSILNSYRATSLRKFCMSITSLTSVQSAERWLKFAAGRNVQEINIQLNARRHCTIKLPLCGSIKVLSLRFQLQDVEFSSAGTFSSLEFLSLQRAILDDKIGDVISKACPRLKTLHLLRCQGINCLRISCPVLEDLKIERCVGLEKLNISGYQLQNLCVQDSFEYESGSSWVDISAPNLKTFKWLDYVVSRFFLGNMICLDDAHVCLLFDFYPVAIADYLERATKLLCHLLCAKCLTVEMVCFWDVSTQKNLLEWLPTPLRNLKQLIVWLDRDDAYVFGGISCLLESCPQVESLSVNIVGHEEHRIIADEFPDKPASNKAWTYPNSLLGHLVEVRIRGFRGMEYELEFAKFLLECARVLKELIIILSREASDDGSLKLHIIEKLGSLPTASPNVSISCF